VFADDDGVGFGPPTASLGALSFRLHKKLAEANNGKEEWGYSRSTGASLAEGRQKNRGAQGGDSDWLSEGGSRAQTAARHEFVGDKIGPAWLTRREGDEVEMKWRRSAQTTV